MTTKEWREKNRERIRNYDKKFYTTHKEERKKEMKKYYLTHKKQMNEQMMKYRKSHAEHIKELKRKHYLKNREKIMERMKIWKKNNSERYKKTIHEWLKRLREKYIIMLGSKCAECGYNKFQALEFHHIYPEERESKNEWRLRSFEQKIKEGKIKLLCANCHKLEHDKIKEGLRVT
jgi:hypothetical protein